MKKLLFILFFIPFLAKAQTEVPGTPAVVQVDNARARFLLNLIPPHFVDTTAANTNKGLDYIGAIIYTTSSGPMYRDTSPAKHKWTSYGSAGSGVATFNGRAGTVIPLTGDYASFYPVLSGSYSDPTWITSLNASKISGTGALTAGSTKIALSGTPGTALLTNVAIDINQGNLSLSSIGGLLNISQINASGTPSSSTFLRGDGSWSAASGGSTYTADETSIHLASTVFGIKSTWTGQTAITTLGTIGTGTWQGTPIATTYGGAPSGGTTNQVLTKNSGTSYDYSWTTPAAGFADPMTTAYDIIYRDGTNTTVRKAKGADGTYLGLRSGVLNYFAPSDAEIAFTNITTNDVSTSKHGYAPILPNDVTKFLNGIGGWTTPSLAAAIAIDATQTYTSGTTVTVSNGNNYIYVNPSSLVAALAITLPATWHNSNLVTIIFGGTITSGNPVVSSLSIIAGSGQTLTQAINPNGLTYYSGEVLQYKLNGTLDYRLQ